MTEQNLFSIQIYPPYEPEESKVLSTEEIRANSEIICGMSQIEFDQMIALEKTIDYFDLKKMERELDELFDKFDKEDSFDDAMSVVEGSKIIS